MEVNSASSAALVVSTTAAPEPAVGGGDDPTTATALATTTAKNSARRREEAHARCRTVGRERRVHASTEDCGNVKPRIECDAGEVSAAPVDVDGEERKGRQKRTISDKRVVPWRLCREVREDEKWML